MKRNVYFGEHEPEDIEVRGNSVNTGGEGEERHVADEDAHEESKYLPLQVGRSVWRVGYLKQQHHHLKTTIQIEVILNL